MAEDRGEFSESMLGKISSGDAFAKLVGMNLLELQPGFARAALKVTENTVNVHDMAHGGAIFTLADLACEAAGNSYGKMAIAVQTNIHFLAAGKCGDLLTATAKMTSRIESFGVIDFEITNKTGRLLSKGQQTVIFK
ncbi:MAG: hotdog fold thioesterase [Desulfobacteraceae bacterium]|nr:hotdog fold thioesterase [Desulfobacteraceae bacterium]